MIYKIFTGQIDCYAQDLISIQTKRVDYYYVTEINYNDANYANSDSDEDSDTIYVRQYIYNTLCEPVIKFY
jgi:hypothetical protein